jgi:hypothetical protein
MSRHKESLSEVHLVSMLRELHGICHHIEDGNDVL